MAAIFGIRYFEKGETVQKDDLLKMANIMTHRGTGEPDLFTFDNIGLGCLHSHSHRTEEVALSIHASDICPVIDGRIYGHKYIHNDSHNNPISSPVLGTN